MPFQIVRNDITKMQVDAIVNTANHMPGYGQGIDSAVYEAAGQRNFLQNTMRSASSKEAGRLLQRVLDRAKSIEKKEGS